MSSINICYHCHSEFPHGAHVCRGCQGDVVYGATQTETSGGIKVGGFLGFLLGAMTITMVPPKLGFAAYFGLTFQGGLMFVATPTILGIVAGAWLVRNHHSGRVRVFRRRFVR